MADKDINIHVRIPGGPEAQQQLDKVKEAVHGVGVSIQGAGEKADDVGGAFSRFLYFFTAAGLLGALVTATKKIAEFFDELKRRTNEAVQNAENLRQAYQGLFEALGAYSEPERKKAITDTLALLSETGTPKEIGVPAIERYTRQFKGVMPETDYQSGLRNVLGFATRHGGTATPELIDIMRGYGMTTAAQQSEFMRTVTAGAGAAGMTDEELIMSLARAAPGSRAMEMTPQETISIVSALAAGEVGRNKTMMPAMVIEAMASPNAEAVKKYGIAGKTSKEIREGVRKKKQGLSAEDRHKMLADIYGAGAVKGVHKLITSGAPSIAPVSEAADRDEAEKYKQTLDAIDAQTNAEAEKQQHEVTSKEVSETSVRQIGWEYQKVLQRRKPIHQWFRELFILGKEMEKEDAAKQLWFKNLTPQERKKYAEGYEKELVGEKAIGYTPEFVYENAPNRIWAEMTPEDRRLQTSRANEREIQLNQRESQSAPVNIHNYNNTYINQTPPDAQPRSNGGL